VVGDVAVDIDKGRLWGGVGVRWVKVQSVGGKCPAKGPERETNSKMCFEAEVRNPGILNLYCLMLYLLAYLFLLAYYWTC
jgi:hypothetical protein